MNTSLIYNHQIQKKIIFWPKRLQQGAAYWCLVAICSSLRDLGTQQAVSLRTPKLSCKIVETLPCEMPNACAISSTWIHLSEYTRSWTAAGRVSRLFLGGPKRAPTYTNNWQFCMYVEMTSLYTNNWQFYMYVETTLLYTNNWQFCMYVVTTSSQSSRRAAALQLFLRPWAPRPPSEHSESQCPWGQPLPSPAQEHRVADTFCSPFKHSHRHRYCIGSYVTRWKVIINARG